jgi:hypothetical protein
MFQRKYTDRKLMYGKMAHIISSKLKTVMSTTPYLLEVSKSGILTTPNAMKDVEPQVLVFISGGNEKW